MPRGGRTPEELETLMEDALILRDGQALGDLFETAGVIITGSDRREMHGPTDIAQAVNLIANLTGGYLAEPRRIFQNRDIVLVVGDGVINVARRGCDRSWRFTIVLLDPALGRAEE